MANRDSLKLGLPIYVFPRNIQNIRLDGASHGFETSDLILCLAGGHAVYPGSVRQNGFFVRLYGVYAVEPDMRSRGCAGKFFVLQKHGKNLNGLESHFGRVGDFQQSSRFGVNESDFERRFTHVFSRTRRRFGPFALRVLLKVKFVRATTHI